MYGFAGTRSITQMRVKESSIPNGGTLSMSVKNRAFALAIATAALVGFCAPMASAATVQGSPSNSGFNGDSILNLSGNQLPINACNNQIPIQGIGAQIPIQSVTALLGLGNIGDTNTTSN